MTSEKELYGDMPVGRMFVRCAIPGMVSGLVWALCTIADGIFVGNFLGSEALAAVNLAWPIMTVAMAVSDLIAAGSSIRIAMHLGAGNVEDARRVFSGSVRLILAFSVTFMVIGVLLGGPMVRAMGAEGFVADTATQYIAVFSLFAPLGLLFFATDNYLRISGAVGLSMWINVAVTVLNIILLAVLIGLLGCGAWASAFATGFSICVGSAASLIPFWRHRLVLVFVKGWLSLREIGRVAYNGMSTFFNTVSGSLFAIIANTVLLAIAGNEGVAAYGIVMYVNSIIFSLFTGMSAAMQPALSYNHGAGDGIRVRAIFLMMSAASLLLGLLVAGLCLVGDEAMVSVFLDEGDADVAAMAATGLTVYALTYLFAWVSLNANQTLASADLPMPALFVGVMSQLILPAAFLVPMSSYGIGGVWWSMVAASMASAVFAGIMLAYGIRRRIFSDRRGETGFA